MNFILYCIATVGIGLAVFFYKKDAGVQRCDIAVAFTAKSDGKAGALYRYHGNV